VAATFGFDPLDSVVMAPKAARKIAAIQATRFVESIKFSSISALAGCANYLVLYTRGVWLRRGR
jgi:hypothetical protein